VRVQVRVVSVSVSARFEGREVLDGEQDDNGPVTARHSTASFPGQAGER